MGLVWDGLEPEGRSEDQMIRQETYGTEAAKASFICNLPAPLIWDEKPGISLR
jgi:hypothetical protein